ncbi:O-fucosyltransferase 16-like isoform X2 [Ipomoea triloba]|uniref:O-fucosyltransferase 16-like isoform X2 n=1 Tax=Ipomoea triloba TaxID=35885 RepID=UPI00125E7513|nr:O-fucosyltransferase 16-like isoform X2 [Ipomoea triloba]
MSLQRRRHQHHRSRSLIPVIFFVSLILLFLFLFLALLAPPLTDSNRLHYRRRDISAEEGGSNVSGVPVFHIPTSGGIHDRDLWKSKNAKFFYGCSNASSKFANAKTRTNPTWYLSIATSGGLNQQRTGIVDAVAVARILNATLVVPALDKNSFWKDSSDFSDIFDVDWFISYLANDVVIIKELPLRRGKTWIPNNVRVPRKCSEKYYINRFVPILNKKHAVRIPKFDYRLSSSLDTELQKLRCRVNYHALKFVDPILKIGKELVQRMRMKSKHYIALHLRFEPDMLAFSGCYYGGGDEERMAFGKIRKRWKTLHRSNPDKGRRQGRCPLTPEEVGLMLRALGYGNDVHIYVASGEIYGGGDTLAPLKELFPNFHTKDTLATAEELQSFSGFSARMAALDFIVCDESDVFVTNNNGNMAKILSGRRRYFGHKPTIRPNGKKLWRLFLGRDNMTWEEFSSQVNNFQRGFMGDPMEVKSGRGFHEYPSPCICSVSDAKEKLELGPQETRDGGNIQSEKEDDDQNVDDLVDMSELEQEEDLNESLMSEESELDEMLSD